MTSGTNEALLVSINDFLRPYGCVITGIGPYAVAVKGDARFYGPSVFVAFPQEMPGDQIAEISNRITNRFPEISRVLCDITTKS